MSDFDYTLLQNPDLLDNPEQRLPCMLVLDTSGSMAGPPINELNAGLDILYREVQSDPIAKKRVEIAIVTFGGKAALRQPFSTIDKISTLSGLTANGGTPMAQALSLGMDELEQRKASYRAAKVSYLRPWLWVISDGAPSGSITSEQARLRAMEANKGVVVFALGVDGANTNMLAGLSSNPPLKLKDANFKALFLWLSASLREASRSRPGGQFVPQQFPAAIST